MRRDHEEIHRREKQAVNEQHRPARTAEAGRRGELEGRRDRNADRLQSRPPDLVHDAVAQNVLHRTTPARIRHELRLEGAAEFVASFARPELLWLLFFDTPNDMTRDLLMGASWAIDSHDGWTLYADKPAPTVQYEHTMVATRRGTVITTLAA